MNETNLIIFTLPVKSCILSLYTISGKKKIKAECNIPNKNTIKNFKELKGLVSLYSLYISGTRLYKYIYTS